MPVQQAPLVINSEVIKKVGITENAQLRKLMFNYDDSDDEAK